MKQLIPFFFSVGLAAFAQTPEPPPPPPPPPPPMPLIMPGAGPGNIGFISHEFSMGGPPVTGAPYSAEQVTEQVQTLADGNRIVNTNTTRMYRDAQGRTRMEMSLPAVSGAAQAPSIITISDPVAGATYMLNSESKSATKMPGPPKLGAEVLAPNINLNPAVALPEPPAISFKIAAEGRQQDAKKEDLGTQQIDGVNVTGKRVTVTIPAGAIGNEQAINTVSETWFSPDLKVMLKSTYTDPRTGQTTVTVKNLSRAEPDPSLFQVPADYTVTEGKNPTVLFHTRLPQ